MTKVVQGTDNHLSYDAENRLSGVSGATTASYLYDGDGHRVQETNAYVNLASGVLPTSEGTIK